MTYRRVRKTDDPRGTTPLLVNHRPPGDTLRVATQAAHGDDAVLRTSELRGTSFPWCLCPTGTS